MWLVVVVLTWGSFQVGGLETSEACVERLNKEIRLFVRTNQTIISAQCEPYEVKK